MTATVATRVQRRPVLGAIAGLCAGLGLSLLLISFAVIALGTLTPVMVTLAGAVVGLVLAMALPARGGAAAAAPVAFEQPPMGYEQPPVGYEQPPGGYEQAPPQPGPPPDGPPPVG